MKKFVVFFAFMCLVAGFGYAAVVQTGNLKGKVYDFETGSPLPEVVVTIQSPALMLPSLETITTPSGFFRFAAIPPGNYTVTFKIAGFKTLVRKNFVVNANVTATLDVVLETTTIQETITVSGKTPTIDKQTNTAIATLDDSFIQQIPSTRTIDTLFNMVPGVTGDTSHGSSERDNTYNLDGVNVTDPVTGTQAGSFSVDIIDEFTIQTGAVTAEQGSVRGAVVNVVTKSGGSKLSGMASVYFRNKALQGDNTKGTVFEGEESGFDYEVEPGFNLGGPIKKHKIWFFGNFSFKKSIEYINGYPFDKTENTPYDRLYMYPYLKLTFQLNPDNKLVLSYNHSEYKRNHRGADYRYNEDATWKQTTPIHTINVQWTRFLGNNFYMNAKGAAMLYALNLMAKNDLPRLYDSTTRRYSQSYGYDDLYKRRRFQAIIDGTRFVDDWMGMHEFKGGLEFEYSFDSRNRVHNMDPRFGLGPFVYTRNDGEPYYVTYYQDFTRKDRKLVISAFIQDSWSPFERLNINIGLRFDHQEGIIPKQGMEREPIEYGGVIYDPRVTESYKPMIWNTFSPRIGVTYDITNDGKTVLKASFGRYYIANILQFFVTTNPNSFISYRYRLNPDWTLRGDMYYFSATAGSKMDPNIESPYLDELTVGIERELFKDFKLGIRYIKKWDRKLIEDVDINALDLNALMRGDDIFTVWTNFAPVTVVDPYDGKTVTFYNMIDDTLAQDKFITNPPGANRDYDGVEVTLDKRLSNKWQMSASYVYAKSRGLIGTDFDDSWTGESYFNDPNYHINRIGDFLFERRHQFKLQFLFQAPLGINVSGFYRLLGGRRYQREIRSIDLLVVDLNQGTRTIYAEKRGTRKYPDLSILDLRLEKMVKLGKINLAVFADCFNVFNINTATDLYELSSTSTTINNNPVVFGDPEDIYDPPRIFRLGARIEF